MIGNTLVRYIMSVDGHVVLPPCVSTWSTADPQSSRREPGCHVTREEIQDHK